MAKQMLLAAAVGARGGGGGSAVKSELGKLLSQFVTIRLAAVIVFGALLSKLRPCRN